VTQNLTGSLAALLAWWQGRTAPDAALHVVDLRPAGDEPVAAGHDAVDAAVDSGATLLVVRGTETERLAACATIALLTGRETSALLFQPEGTRDADWMADCIRVRDLAEQSATARTDPHALLTSLAAPGIASLAAALQRAAARRTPCLLDGVEAHAAALVAGLQDEPASTWWLAATTSPDAARTAVIGRLDLAVGLPLGLSDESGCGAWAVTSVLALLLDERV
jgi:nicotinate-nucleotide--dimethylbenzimidazole phosphoribosyltransferase